MTTATRSAALADRGWVRFHSATWVRITAAVTQRWGPARKLALYDLRDRSIALDEHATGTATTESRHMVERWGVLDAGQGALGLTATTASWPMSSRCRTRSRGRSPASWHLASSPPRCSRRVARMPASWMPGTGRCAPIGISAALLGKIWPRRGACSDLAIVERAAIARKDIVDRCAIFEVAFGHSPFPWPGLSGPLSADVSGCYTLLQPYRTRAVGHRVPCRFLPLQTIGRAGGAADRC